MKKTTLLAGLLAAGLLLPCLSGPAAAQIKLFGDRLRVKGSVYEFGTYLTAVKKEDREFRNTRFGLMRTKGTLELLYDVMENEQWDVNLFGFFQWWHEAVPDFDGRYRRSISSRARHRYQGPYERADDWINELYADVYAGQWNIRAGKQLVFWSEVEMVRTIDRINPLDLRYTTPGIDPWDEMKLGLWMLRVFYTSNLPGQLVFEGIWIPGDFQRVRTPLEGTSLGSNPAPPVVMGKQAGKIVPYGQNAAIDDMFRRDQPAFTLDNSQFAFRIKGVSDIPLFGTSYLVDWTLSWYHGMNTTPVARRGTLGRPAALNLDAGTLNGYLNSLALRRVFGANIQKAPHKSFWRYKYFDAIGVSGQTFVPALKGVLRGEISYEIGVPENKAYPRHIDDNPSYSKVITGTTERDQVNVGITFDRPLRWEWLQNQVWLASSGIIDTTIGWFGQRRMGNVTRIRRTFGYYDRTQSNFTLTMRGNIWHNEVFPVLRFLYNTRNWGYGVFALKYQPGRHMRYEGGYLWFFAKDPWNSAEAYVENRDFVYLRIGYEF